MPSFSDTVTEAVAALAESGFVSAAELELWVGRIRQAAIADLVPEREIEELLRRELGAIYHRLVERGQILRHHRGVSRFTLEHVKPDLRLELNRRMLAAANLIKLNRQEAIETTLRRFSGWASSLPPGGAPTVERRAAATMVRREVLQLRFRDRRVAIDQSHRFAANLSEILSVGGGALAARWHHHYVRYPRKDHVDREGKVYAIRGNWAIERGLMKRGPNGYTDEVERPGELILCRCSYEYLYRLGGLPEEFLTERGKSELERLKSAA